MNESSQIKNEVVFIEPIPVSKGLSNIFEVFKRNTLNAYFPVINELNQPLGLIHENDFKQYVYTPFGKELLFSRSLKKELKDFIIHCPSAEIDTTLDRILEIFSFDQNQHHDGIIITENGFYCGFLTSSALLKIVNKRNLKIKQLESINMVAVTAGDQINTPLGVIIGRATIISSMISCDDHKIAKNINLIKEQAYRIKRTVDAIKNIKVIQDKDYKLDDLKMLDLSNLK